MAKPCLKERPFNALPYELGFAYRIDIAADPTQYIRTPSPFTALPELQDVSKFHAFATEHSYRCNSLGCWPG